MEFQIIDRSSWARESYFQHYHQEVPCSYSLTATLDVTRLREGGVKLYPALLYLLTAQVNEQPQFRTAFNRDGVLGIYDAMCPSYTVFHPQEERFSNLWTPWDPDYKTFLASYLADQAQFGAAPGFSPKPGQPDNVFTVSMVPWITFEGFHLNLPKGNDYLIPIFTAGKLRQEGGRQLLPLAIQVHHAVCDGYHVGRFLEGLQEKTDAFPL